MTSPPPTMVNAPVSMTTGSASSEMTSMDERMCQVVRHYPELYNKSLEGFKDKQVKEAAWARVAQEVGMADGKDSEYYFGKLRKTYTTAKNNLKKAFKNAQMTSTECQSKIEEVRRQNPHLVWLDPYIKERVRKPRPLMPPQEDAKHFMSHYIVKSEGLTSVRSSEKGAISSPPTIEYKQEPPSNWPPQTATAATEPIIINTAGYARTDGMEKTLAYVEHAVPEKMDHDAASDIGEHYSPSMVSTGPSYAAAPPQPIATYTAYAVTTSAASGYPVPVTYTVADGYAPASPYGVPIRPTTYVQSASGGFPTYYRNVHPRGAEQASMYAYTGPPPTSPRDGKYRSDNRVMAEHRDEESLFGELVASQLRQMTAEQKVRAKYEINRITYGFLMSNFPSASNPLVQSSAREGGEQDEDERRRESGEACTEVSSSQEQSRADEHDVE